MGSNANTELQMPLYYAMYALVAEPKIFNQLPKLMELDELHRETFSIDPLMLKTAEESALFPFSYAFGYLHSSFVVL